MPTTRDFPRTRSAGGDFLSQDEVDALLNGAFYGGPIPPKEGGLAQKEDDRFRNWVHRRLDRAEAEAQKTGLKCLSLDPYETFEFATRIATLFEKTLVPINKKEFWKTIEFLSNLSIGDAIGSREASEFFKDQIPFTANHARLWIAFQDLNEFVPMDRVRVLRMAWYTLSKKKAEGSLC